MIGTKNAPVEEESKYVSPYIKPGINDNISIQSIEFTKAQTGNTGLKFTFVSEPVEELDNKPRVSDTTLWFGERTIDSSISRISDMARAAEVKEEMDKIEANDPDSYAKAISPIICNKPMRIKMIGVEVEGKEGKSNWFKAELPWKYFAEKMSVKIEETNLRFDPNSSYDMKKIPSADVDDSFEAKNDLPF